MNTNSYDEEGDSLAYVPRLHRLAGNQRFSSKKGAMLSEAAQAWELSLPQDDKLAVRLLNAYQSLLTGEKRIASLSGPLLTLLTEAMGYDVGPEHSIDDFRATLAPFFFQVEDLLEVSSEDLLQVSDNLLRDWAAVLGVDYQQERQDVIHAILAYQSAFRPDPDSSADEDQPAGTKHPGRASAPASSSSLTSLLTAVHPPRHEQHKRLRPNEEHFLLSQSSLNWTPDAPGLCERIVPIVGRELRAGYVVVYIKGDLQDTDVCTSLLVTIDDNRTLVWVAGDVIPACQGLSGQGMSQVPGDCKVFILNSAGLAATSPLLGRWRGFVQAPGDDNLAVPRSSPRLASQDDRVSSSLAKVDREEEARPARILMDPERFACASGLSGKFDTDYALTTYALAVPACDRHLLGASNPHLRCLAAGLFAFTLQEKKVQGTHLRAFHDARGSEFRYVSQIQRALRVLGRVYDAIIHVDPKVHFFRTIFNPLIDLLDDGADRGLRDLPVAFVEERVTELLVKMSCVIRHPSSDQLTRAELCANLMEALHLDLGLVVTQGALFQMNASSRRSSSSSSMNGNGKSFKSLPRGRGASALEHGKSHRLDKPCFSQLALHFNVGSHGCRAGDRCPFGHDMSKFTSTQLKAAAESTSNANLRKRLLEAFNNKSG